MLALFLAVCGSFSMLTNSYILRDRLSVVEDFYELFEGDIILSPGEDLTDRNAMRDRSLRWPGGIVWYQFDHFYSSEDRELIRNAMDEFEMISPGCIQFKEGTGLGDYLFITPVKGCASSVGMIGGEQTLSLAKGCLKKGTVMHELMHSLGFRHEQSRADRDAFVTIHWDNINNTRKSSFNKYSWEVLDRLNTTYDHSSVMHYHAWEFAVNKKKPTITPKDDDVFLYELGFAQDKGELTKTDVLKLQRYYEC